MKRIFAGIVFIFVNLEIFSIDVLPNFVGYILLILGVRELLPDSKINRAAQGLLAVGGLVHLAAQVYGVVSSFSAGTQQLFNIAASIPAPNPFFAVGLPMLISVVTLLLFWAVPISLILQGISQLEGVEKSDMSTINIAWVLGLLDFDETVFSEQISEIRIPTHNKLVFVFNDGESIEADWQNPSRRESWTPEMK